MTTIAQWEAGAGVTGAPPWDGTGVPFPVDANGVPVIPGAGGPEQITATPGSSWLVAHDDPLVVASPSGAWTANAQPAHFTDGDFVWDGTAWQVYVPTDILSVLPIGGLAPAGSNFDIEAITNNDPGYSLFYSHQVPGYPNSALYGMSKVDATHYRGLIQTFADGYVEGAVLTVNVEFPGPAEREPGTDPLYTEQFQITLTAPTAPLADETAAAPRSDWTVPQLDAYAAENDIEGYPLDANKPEKLAFLQGGER